MTKKKRRARAASPSRYGTQTRQLNNAPFPAPQRDESAEDVSKAVTSPTRQPAGKVDFAVEYHYVYQDLRRIAILAGAILSVLVILSFVVP